MAGDGSRTKAGVRRLLRNRTSLAGMALAVVSAANIFLFVLLDLIAKYPSPYVGILAYLVAPGFLVCALFLIGLGAWRERGRLRRKELAETPSYPRLDLNEAATR